LEGFYLRAKAYNVADYFVAYAYGVVRVAPSGSECMHVAATYAAVGYLYVDVDFIKWFGWERGPGHGSVGGGFIMG
jgi:predicted CoA-binding protein